MLPELLRRATRHVSDLDKRELRSAVVNLHDYYIPSRYPAEVGGSTGPITSEEATEAIAWAEEITAAVRPRLDG